MSGSTRGRRGAGTISFLVAVALFAPLLGSDFIWDDRVVILDDPRVQDPGLWGQFLTEAYHGGVDRLYRPLVSFSYALQWQLHGPSTLLYHAVNLLAHGLCAALVAMLGRRWFGPRAGLIAGLIFAVHPLCTEVVATVVYRTESFATALALAAVAVATLPLTPRRMVAAAALWLAATLCKESVIVLGVLLPLLAWLAQRTEITAERRRQLRAFGAMMLLATAAYMLLREAILPMAWDRSGLLDWTVNAVIAAEGIHRVLLPLVILGRYTALYAWPAKLSVDHEGVLWPQVSAADPYLWIGVLALATWVALVAIAWRRGADRSLICLLAAAAAYFVISNSVVLIGIQLGDRLLYLPAAFIAILVGATLARWRWGPAVGLCLVLPLAARSLDYQRYWKNDWTISQHAATRYPESVHGLLVYAHLQGQRGDLAGALQTLERARQHHPVYPTVWYLSARYATLAGHSAEAEAFTTRAEELEKVYPNRLSTGDRREP
jgi:hypothetical protein